MITAGGTLDTYNMYDVYRGPCNKPYYKYMGATAKVGVQVPDSLDNMWLQL